MDWQAGLDRQGDGVRPVDREPNHPGIQHPLREFRDHGPLDSCGFPRRARTQGADRAQQRPVLGMAPEIRGRTARQAAWGARQRRFIRAHRRYNDGGASASQAASNGFIGQFPMTVVPLT